jgi:hypothetical protein
VGVTCIPWIAAFNYRADVPLWLQRPLAIMGIALAALLLGYFVLSILRSAHRKAYNLTKAETAQPGKGPGPAFLTVDHEARAEAVRRGDEYVRPADAAAAQTSAEQAASPTARKEPFAFGRMACRLGALTVGSGHVVLLLASLFKSTKDADAVWSRITTWERLSAVIGRYWFGFALVGVVITAELVRFTLRKRKA